MEALSVDITPGHTFWHAYKVCPLHIFYEKYRRHLFRSRIFLTSNGCYNRPTVCKTRFQRYSSPKITISLMKIRSRSNFDTLSSRFLWPSLVSQTLESNPKTLPNWKWTFFQYQFIWLFSDDTSHIDIGYRGYTFRGSCQSKMWVQSDSNILFSIILLFIYNIDSLKTNLTWVTAPKNNNKKWFRICRNLLCHISRHKNSLLWKFRKLYLFHHENKIMTNYSARSNFLHGLLPQESVRRLTVTSLRQSTLPKRCKKIKKR